MDLHRLYEYLLVSRERVFDAVRPLTAEEWRRAFPFGLTSIGATLTHLLTSEWYYVERVMGHDVPPYETWPIKEEQPPPFSVVESTWRTQGARVKELVARERQWTRPVTWLGFPDGEGRRFQITTTAEECFLQLALHEAHHRAQAMAMLRGVGRPLEDIDFNALMFTRVLVSA